MAGIIFWTYILGIIVTAVWLYAILRKYTIEDIDKDKAAAIGIMSILWVITWIILLTGYVIYWRENGNNTTRGE